MKVTVQEDAAARYRVLVCAPETAELADLGHLASGSELDELREIEGLAVDALVGQVAEQELSDALLEGSYTVLHCASHGDGTGIALSGKFLDGNQLGRLLQVHDVRIALLMTCQSQGFAQAVAAAGVDWVIATRHDVANDVARRFTREFYRFLVRSQAEGRAFAYAQSRLSEVEAAGFTLVEAENGTPTRLTRTLQQLVLRMEQMETESRAWRMEAAGLLKQMEASLRQQNREVVKAIMQLVGVLGHD